MMEDKYSKSEKLGEGTVNFNVVLFSTRLFIKEEID